MVDSERGWKEWCEYENEYDWIYGEPFIFTLKNDAKILKIKTFDDIPDEKFVNDSKDLHPYSVPNYYLDYEKLAKEYDGIEINAGTDNRLYQAFLGWDCDSICIFNPNIIEGGHYK